MGEYQDKTTKLKGQKNYVLELFMEYALTIVILGEYRLMLRLQQYLISDGMMMNKSKYF